MPLQRKRVSEAGDAVTYSFASAWLPQCMEARVAPCTPAIPAASPRRSAPPLALLSLPPEVLAEIGRHLSPVAQLHCWACVCKALRGVYVHVLLPAARAVFTRALRGGRATWATIPPARVHRTPVGNLLARLVAPAPPTRLWSCAATLHPHLPARVLVFGGEGAGFFYANDVHALHLDTWTWQRLATSGTPPAPRGFASLHVHRGRLIVFGGQARDGPRRWRFYNDVHALDLDTLTWTRLNTHGEAPSPRVGHRSVLLDSCLIVHGGTCVDETGMYTYYDDVHMLDLDSHIWERCVPHGPSPAARQSHVLVPVQGGVLIQGGNSDVSNVERSNHDDAHVLNLCTSHEHGQHM